MDRIDERAQQLRLEYLGTEAGECIPWAELKQVVRDRWRRAAEFELPQPEVDNDIHQARVLLGIDGTASLADAVRGLKAERDAARAELAATRTAPVKVRFDCTEKEAANVFNGADLGGDGLKCLRVLMDYLAARAVIDVPPGVPSAEELAGVIEGNRTPVDAGRSVLSYLAPYLAAPVDPAQPTDAQVEALAVHLRQVYADYCKLDANQLDKETFRIEARAAFAHIAAAEWTQKYVGVPDEAEFSEPADAPKLERLAEIAQIAQKAYNAEHYECCHPNGAEFPHISRKEIIRFSWLAAIRAVLMALEPRCEVGKVTYSGGHIRWHVRMPDAGPVEVKAEGKYLKVVADTNDYGGIILLLPPHTCLTFTPNAAITLAHALWDKAQAAKGGV
jgi:hypothetical protein